MNLDEGQTLISRFLIQAASRPDSIAVSFKDIELSYAELDRRSLGLARTLRAHGAGRDKPVAICMDRSPDLIVEEVP